MKKSQTNMYCVVGRDNGLIDISQSKGATKRHANKHGYTQIWARDLRSNACWIVATKTGDVWDR